MAFIGRSTREVRAAKRAADVFRKCLLPIQNINQYAYEDAP
jgi:hypothetical protein